MSKYTDFARGKPCQIRLPGICNHNPETSVFCHLGGGGMGRKRLDIHGAIGCSDCHDVVDGRRHEPKLEPDEIAIYFYDALIRTQEMMVKEGVLKL